MFTPAEKKYLLLTLIFLVSGSGIKAYRHSKVKIGPIEDSAFLLLDSLASQPSQSAQPESDSIQRPVSTPSATKTASPSKHKPTLVGKVSINQADAKELMLIRGIGEKTAQLIIEYRRDHGPFLDLKDLVQVKGIGEKKLEKIIPFLIL